MTFAAGSYPCLSVKTQDERFRQGLTGPPSRSKKVDDIPTARSGCKTSPNDPVEPLNASLHALPSVVSIAERSRAHRRTKREAYCGHTRVDGGNSDATT
ncbi:hypothetical protein Trydic_g5228 [Trypoxylus dichotomus]